MVSPINLFSFSSGTLEGAQRFFRTKESGAEMNSWTNQFGKNEQKIKKSILCQRIRKNNQFSAICILLIKILGKIIFMEMYFYR